MRLSYVRSSCRMQTIFHFISRLFRLLSIVFRHLSSFKAISDRFWRPPIIFGRFWSFFSYFGSFLAAFNHFSLILNDFVPIFDRYFWLSALAPVELELQRPHFVLKSTSAGWAWSFKICQISSQWWYSFYQTCLTEEIFLMKNRWNVEIK